MIMKHAKAVVALLAAVAVSASTFVAADSPVGKWLTVVIALAGALGVYAAPNKPAPPKS